MDECFKKFSLKFSKHLSNWEGLRLTYYVNPSQFFTLKAILDFFLSVLHLFGMFLPCLRLSFLVSFWSEGNFILCQRWFHWQWLSPFNCKMQKPTYLQIWSGLYKLSVYTCPGTILSCLYRGYILTSNMSFQYFFPKWLPFRREISWRCFWRKQSNL